MGMVRNPRRLLAPQPCDTCGELTRGMMEFRDPDGDRVCAFVACSHECLEFSFEVRLAEVDAVLRRIPQPEWLS